MKRESKNKIKWLFMLLLISLAVSPLGVLGHELWHVFFGYFYGEPISLCVNFNQDSFASVDVVHPIMKIETQCNIGFVNELIAYTIQLAITFLMLYIFTKKYGELFDKLK